MSNLGQTSSFFFFERVQYVRVDSPRCRGINKPVRKLMKQLYKMCRKALSSWLNQKPPYSNKKAPYISSNLGLGEFQFMNGRKSSWFDQNVEFCGFLYMQVWDLLSTELGVFTSGGDFQNRFWLKWVPSQSLTWNENGTLEWEIPFGNHHF